MKLEQKIEALLFYTTEPMSCKKIAKVLGASEDEVRDACDHLRESLHGRGIALVQNGDDVLLATHPKASDLITQLRKEELGGALSKAALETLTIVTYHNGISKHDIDYIRGVNSNFILRNLMMRGLVERMPHPEDKRTSLYRPTLDTLTFLGVTSVEELPEYEALHAKLDVVIDEPQSEEDETALSAENSATDHEETST